MWAQIKSVQTYNFVIKLWLRFPRHNTKISFLVKTRQLYIVLGAGRQTRNEVLINRLTVAVASVDEVCTGELGPGLAKIDF